MTRPRSSSAFRVYDLRWLLSAVVLGAIALLFVAGSGRIATFSDQVDALADAPPEAAQPRIFDARYDIWFDPDDPGLQLYQRIEDKFVAEDFVLVAFEEPDDPLGVFAPDALAAIARLTKAIERIPYVRHVRSLTSNPWIRWDTIGENPETGEIDEGLIISDLFEGDPTSYGERELVQRIVAVLGGEGASRLIGEDRVRAVVGEDADFADLIGEPRMIGNIISANGRTSALQVLVLRPRTTDEQRAEVFGDDERSAVVGTSMHGNEAQWGALDAIRQALDDDPGGFAFHIAGMPTIESNFMTVGQEDMGVVAYMFLAIAIVLFLMFRRVMAVVTPMLVIFSSIFGMLGSIWLLGDLFNNITAGAPNMVTAISIADAVHLIASYYMLRGGYTDRRELIAEVIRRNAMPVFLTTVTTAIGFFSLMAGNIIPLEMLGYTAGLGTLFAYAVSMTLVPAMLSLLPLPKTPVAPETLRPVADPNAPHWTTPLLRVVLAWRKTIVVGALAITFAALYGLTRIELDTDFRTMFPEDNVAMVDMDWIEDRLGGSGDLEIVFEAPAVDEPREQTVARQSRIEELQIRALGSETSPDEFPPLDAGEQADLDRMLTAEADYQRRRIAITAEFLDELRRFGDRLRSEMRDQTSPLRFVTRLDGALDVLRKISQVQNENRAAYYRTPTEADVASDARESRLEFDEFTEEAELIPAQNASTLAAQYFLQYENGAKPAENLATLISSDRRTVRVQGRVEQASSLEQQAAFDRIREIATAEFPKLAAASPDVVERGEALSTMTLSGKTLLYAGMSDKFSRSFVLSMSLALAVITLLIALIYRSVTVGLLSIVPNVLPIVLPIGLFGLLGRAVDGPAVFVSSVALGICVDDTIHFFTKFTRARRQGLPTNAALSAALREVGNALTITTLVLVLGFGVLALSQFSPNSMMGKLAAVMIALAWVADFVVTPALLTLLPDPNRATAPNDAPLPAAATSPAAAN